MLRPEIHSGTATQDGDARGTAAFGDFFGSLTRDCIEGRRPSGHCVEVTVRRDASSVLRFPGQEGVLNFGSLSIEGGVLGPGRQWLSNCQQGFYYSYQQLSASRSRETGRHARCKVEVVNRQEEEEEESAGVVKSHARAMTLSVPLPLSGESLSGLEHVLNAWASAAVKALAAAAAALPGLPVDALALAGSSAFLPVLQAFAAAAAASAGAGALSPAALAALPLKFSGIADLDVIAGSFANAAPFMSTHVGIFSLASAFMFIASIRGLNKHASARQGNLLGMLATALGIISVAVSPGFNGAHARFFVTFALAGLAGYGVAVNVKMENMPQVVAGFHSFVGLAAVFAGFATFLQPGSFSSMKAIEIFVGTAVGALTFTGSVVAAGKFHGILPGRPIVLDHRWVLNSLGAASSICMGALFANPAVYASPLGTVCLASNSMVWAALGVNMVMAIGGADMPVVVSLLNAFSGVATSAAGFMLSNNLLTITGALVASSGTLLTDIMCRGINRSMVNVLIGGFGTDSSISSASAAVGAAAGDIREVSQVGLVEMLLTAKRVAIVPGYGMAVARCQHHLADVVALLRAHGVQVHFAIHPVAGRLPGHMNVLLAEADVPNEIVREMEDMNKDLPAYDVAIVVGANDIVNPATQDDPTSPIYGMPAIEVWRCKKCVVLKRSMGTGYSGVDNPLFYRENVHMLFGDAKNSIEGIFHHLEERQLLLHPENGSPAGSPLPSAETTASAPAEVEVFPAAVKCVGVLRERSEGERCSSLVSMAPSVVLRMRRMGFSILLEAGAGVAAGFADEDYVRLGGVAVAESSEEVLKQADIIIKASAPSLAEVHGLVGQSQTMIGFWNMYGTEELTKALGQSSATFANLSLVPRVSRAQKLDALTSMANIAGYRAVIDAFNQLPRFSRSSVTACGAVAPARVFVIGVGVAGLSAIATAHALGAKVFAHDLREATREQVESMGAEFVPVEALSIAGEGAGGYATEVDDAQLAAQRATFARLLPGVDIVITTAMIPNRAAPQLITVEMLQSMKHGSVIVDLAAQTGGNCVATQRDQVVKVGGVTVIGETNYPSQMASQASEMLASNFAAMLETLGGGSNFGGKHWEDPIVRPATVVRDGELLWPPPLRSPPAPTAGPAAAAATAPEAARPPEEVNAIIEWLHDHKHEIAMSLGAAVVLGLGFGADIPEAELTHIGYFVLSLLIGHFTVAGVTPALHTPLISVTNAISGIIIVGGMLQLNGPLLSARVACALAAVFLSGVNIVGGFAVTQRMLDMFKEDTRR